MVNSIWASGAIYDNIYLNLSITFKTEKSSEQVLLCTARCPSELTIILLIREITHIDLNAANELAKLRLRYILSENKKSLKKPKNKQTNPPKKKQTKKQK